MQKIGFLGMGVMGLPMAKNVVQKCGLPVLGYDVVQQQMDAFREAGGIPVSDPAEIYKACDVILQILPTHPIIRNSVEQAIQYGKPGNVIVDLSSTAPDIILELYQQANKRLHRQGQAHPVIVHHLVVQGGMDEDVVAALHDKGDSQEALMQALKARIEKARCP